jgi:ABC-type nitrate/sulfonate/bicarbonate transport system substrate-binding protein
MKINSTANRIIAAALISIAVLLASCGKQTTVGAQDKTTAQESTNIASAPQENFVIRAVTQTTFSETIVAYELGFFEDEGIEINFIGALGSGISQFQGIELGEIDLFTQGHLTSVGQARLAGIDVKAVTPGFIDDPDNPHVTYLVRQDSDLQTLDDLPGHTVVATASVCTDGFIKRYCNENGLDWRQIEFISLSGKAGIAESSVLEGLVDVTTSHTPWGGIGQTKLGLRKLGTSWDIFHSPSAGLAVRGFSDQFIEKYPDVVQGFSNAEYRARVFIENYPELSNFIGGRYLKMDPDEISSNSYDQNKNIRDDWAAEWITMSEEEGYWEKGEINPEDIYTNAFVPEDAPESDYDRGAAYVEEHKDEWKPASGADEEGRWIS